MENLLTTQIQVQVNGTDHRLSVEPNLTLLELLREKLLLTGTKEGCGEGDCGACVVLMNGEPVNSCLVLALDADGARITTIEGLAGEDGLHPVQEAFMDHGAVQCGFCSPGMILSAASLLEKEPHPDEAQIKEALSGVLCRCGSYPRILEAVQSLGAAQPGEGGRDD